MITNNIHSTKRRTITHTKAYVDTYRKGLCFALVFVLAIAMISCGDDPNGSSSGSSNGGTKPGVKSCDSIVTTETPESTDDLKALIDTAIADKGNEVDLNYIDTSKITNMGALFQGNGTFNGDIRCWDVSSVLSMILYAPIV